MPNIPSEHQEQVNFIHKAKKLFRSMGHPELIPLLFAIPNGGRRDARTAASLKMEGVRKGVPDLFFAYPVQQFHGLFMEMKKIKGGRVSTDQKKMMLALAKAGFCCTVPKGCDAAMEILTDYLGDTI